MEPTKCVICNGDDQVDAMLNSDRVHVVSRKGWKPSVPLQCSVCLSCGFVSTYLLPDDLEKVRSWKVGEVGE